MHCTAHMVRPGFPQTYPVNRAVITAVRVSSSATSPPSENWCMHWTHLERLQRGSVHSTRRQVVSSCKDGSGGGSPVKISITRSTAPGPTRVGVPLRVRRIESGNVVLVLVTRFNALDRMQANSHTDALDRTISWICSMSSLSLSTGELPINRRENLRTILLIDECRAAASLSARCLSSSKLSPPVAGRLRVRLMRRTEMSVESAFQASSISRDTAMSTITHTRSRRTSSFANSRRGIVLKWCTSPSRTFSIICVFMTPSSHV